MLGQRGGRQFADLLAGGGAHGLVAGRVGVPDQRVARVAHREVGGGQLGGGGAQRAAGLGGRAAGLGERVQVRLGGRLALVGGVVAQTVAQLGGRLVEVGGGRLRGLQGAQQLAVLDPGTSNASRRSASSPVATRSSCWACSGSVGTSSAGSSVCASSPPAGAERSTSPRSRPSCSLATAERASMVATSSSARPAAACRAGPSAPSGLFSSSSARVRTLLVSRSSSACAAVSSLSARACSARRSAPTPTFS